MPEDRILRQAEAISAAIAAGEPRDSVFQRIVNAIHELGFGRVRLDLLSGDDESLVPVSAAGFNPETLGGPVPAASDPDFLALRDLRVPRVLSSPNPRGSVPILLKQKVIGRITVEKSSPDPPLRLEHLEAVKIFAGLAALAQAVLWAGSLETLQERTRAITPIQDRNKLLEAIVEGASILLDAKSGGIYEFRRQEGELTCIADFNRPHQIGKTLKLGEGMVGRLIGSGNTFSIVPNYSEYEGRAEFLVGSFGAVLMVLLIWKGEELGALYVDDQVGRKFSAVDVRLLSLFADQAAICLVNSYQFERDQRKRKRLAQVTQEMMGNLDAMSWRDRLEKIARSAAEILESETANVFRVQDDQLILEASFGRQGDFTPGKIRLKIHNEDGRGVTGWVAYHGQLFNAYGDHLDNHPAVDEKFDPYLPSGVRYSLLAIPLKRRQAGEEILVGLLRVDNKKGLDGKPHKGLRFTEEDEEILTTFADAAVLAIESAELVDQLKEQRDFQEWLISSSIQGIIAVDRRGLVTEFNRRAQEILGYRREDVMGTWVGDLYHSPEAPKRIGRMLHEAPDHRVRDYETMVKSRDDEEIPILLSATWLYNSQGVRIGSVAFFEDLREKRAQERRQSLLLEATDVLTRADDLEQGLSKLTKMMVHNLGRSFCRILLIDEDGEFLTLSAEYLKGNPDWQSTHKKVELRAWPGLREKLEDGAPYQISRAGSEENLDSLGRFFGFGDSLQSLLAVPLRLGGKIVGQLDLGDVSTSRGSTFQKEDIQLVSAIASQVTVLIHRFQLLENTAREMGSGAEKLKSFYELSGELIALKDPHKIRDRIVEQTVEASGSSWVSLALIDAAGRASTPVISREFFSNGRPISIRPNGLSMQVMTKGKAIAIENVDKVWDQINPSMRESSVKAAICLPLSLPGRNIGVMWIHYDQARKFPEFEVAALQLYVNQAAMAYDSARRLETLEHLREASTLLEEAVGIGEVLQRIVDGAKWVLQADYTVLWFYDAERGNFIPERSVYSGHRHEAWRELLRSGPRKQGTAVRILKQGWLAVEDIQERDQAETIGDTTLHYLKEIGGRAFQGMALQAGGERSGVLYAIYSKARSFREEDRETALTFAGRAALALQKAKLLDQVRLGQKAVEAVVRVTTLENIEHALSSIVFTIQKTLSCGAVLLFRCDPQTGKVIHPPNMAGVALSGAGAAPVLSEALILKMLEINQLIDDISDEPLFQDSPLAREQSIETCAAVPLVAAEGRVGVLFIGYRARRRLVTDELDNMKLFAQLAVLAIRNSQLFEAGAVQSARQRDSEPAVVPELSLIPERRRRKGRILLVHNNSTDLERWQRRLDRAGYDVVALSWATEAHHRGTREAFDVAIINLQLTRDNDAKDVSGADLARLLSDYVPSILLAKNPSADAIIKLGREKLEAEIISEGEGEKFLLETIENVILHRVFVVHGRDVDALAAVVEFLKGSGVRPIVLRDEPGGGRTIIEKFEHYSNVSFAVVLMTPDDVGRFKSDVEDQQRARQNVILELGYFLGAIGRSRVALLHKQEEKFFEMPSDYYGVEHISLESDTWQSKLIQEMKLAGIKVN